MLLLEHCRQGIGSVRLGGRHSGGPPGRPPARGRLRSRRRGLAGLREVDDRNDHRDRPLAQDDRDGHAEKPRPRPRGQGCPRDRRAGGRGPRRKPLRQGLRLQRRSPSGSSLRRRSVSSASTSPGTGPSTSSGTRATPRRTEPGTSGASSPTGYARADSPSTLCWSRTCAQSPRSARSGGPTAREHGRNAVSRLRDRGLRGPRSGRRPDRCCGARAVALIRPPALAAA